MTETDKIQNKFLFKIIQGDSGEHDKLVIYFKDYTFFYKNAEFFDALRKIRGIISVEYNPTDLYRIEIKKARLFSFDEEIIPDFLNLLVAMSPSEYFNNIYIL